jgi:drug/metabolite transporter (DMT)-like permease
MAVRWQPDTIDPMSSNPNVDDLVPASTAPVPPAHRAHLDLFAVVCLIGCCALWGMNQVTIKLVLPEVPAMLQLAIRSGVAFVLVLLWMRHRGIGWSPRDGTLVPGLLSGLLFAIEFACIFVGLQHTTAARSVVFINTSPFVVAIVLALLVPSERLRPLQIAGLVLAFGSIALAFGDPGSGGGLLGDLLVLGAGLMWGLTTVVIRLSALRTAPSELTLAYQLGMATLVSVVAAVATGQTAALGQAGHWSAIAWGSLFYQAVIVTFASYLLWFWLLTRYPTTKVQAFVFLSPVFGTLFAGLVLGEPVTALLLVGLAGVGIGLSLLNRRG